ncbi:HmuY family protein [Pedobacter sp. AW31-3R]|uniref:HmuY family protein n=1 Tax=Pedobacter sp. AW31-3R TaxID=3445781 RepID=UPI003F9EE6A4
MMTKQSVLLALLSILFLFSACKDETTEFFPIAPVAADTLILGGVSGTEVVTGNDEELIGAVALNSVFVDLSTSTQTTALRTKWDLGFYGGTDFRVILNHSTGATAVKLDKNNMNAVGESDSTALVGPNTLVFGNGTSNVDPMTGSFADYLSGTVVDEVSATDAENMVYMVNRGMSGVTGTVTAITARNNWRKFRVLRSARGYTVQYAAIGATTFSTVTINKNTSNNFSYLSFTGGEVTVEPVKKLWDIQWTYTSYPNAEGNPVGTTDFVRINAENGVTAAQVMVTSAITYRNFSAANLEGVTFSAERDVIGVNWRNLATAGSSVYRDRFYLIKDTEGNIYKLRFNSFTRADGGTRGRPNIDYILVQAAEI